MFADLPPPVPERTAHPFLTYEEILDVPAAMRASLATIAAEGSGVADRLKGRTRLIFTGCGTALFTAMVGAAVTASLVGPRAHVDAIPAFELGRDPGGWPWASAVFGVSHSGITKATVDALRRTRSQAARTVGVTHFRDRPIAAVSDDLVIAGDGPDRSRCHTKCFAAGAAALAGLALRLDASAASGSRERLSRGLDAIPDAAAEILRTSDPAARDLAKGHVARRAVFVVGAGPNIATALEVALKFKESSFVPAEGTDTEAMIHGPWQAADAETLALVIAVRGPGRDRGLDLVRALRTVGAPVVAVVTEGDRELADAAAASFEIPETDEVLSPFLAVLPLYLLAYHSSVLRGHNPDVLRYLTPAYWRARQIVFPPGTH